VLSLRTSVLEMVDFKISGPDNKGSDDLRMLPSFIAEGW